ncbi:type II toxin-antitoxin system RelB/DinJ family antitoxin [Evtepia sp.]|uniref:type II toxin-antitoxin system RelB/DinJ family antitoxin n=1 Tax=Evtepia sp. TaxID=2773933 RepID=UPI002A806BE6|nr:type II toxin-antitoxin system RelB/DinJ family antitoxin [Evtepia sp.]MDY4430612.1 type II toxin-antitoxin system RelB/DinJ family antitoxin [Evtepia sp.]
MAMDATLQVRMDHELKVQVEELYRSLGTSFAEAVRIFAQQSLREGGMPFRPTLKTWDELTAEEIHAKLTASEADLSAGRVCSQEELDARIQARLNRG